MNVDNVKALIHTYIHVLLKTRKNIIFVDNYIGSREYIDTGPLSSSLKNIEGGRKNSKKLILVMISIISIVILLAGSIAYYRIVVNGSITGSTGNAVFVLRDTEDGESWNNKVIDLGKINPGDSGSFDVVMDASGSSVDMYATLSIDRGVGDTELPTNLKFYTTSNHKSELHKYYSFLEKNGTNKETLTIYWYWNPYIDDIEDAKYMNKSFSASINVNAVQISEYAMMKNGANYVPSTHAYNGTEFWNDDYRKYIRSITFKNDLSNLPGTCNDANLCFDVSENNSIKKVYAYLIESGLTIEEWDSITSATVNKPLYNLYIVSETPIFAPTNCDFFFSNFNNLEKIDFNNNFNTSKVESTAAMFAPVLTSAVSPRNNNTSSRIMLLSNAYTNDEIELGTLGDENKIKKLDLSEFNTSNVANMYGMFYYCKSLTNLDLSNFNTSKVTDMSSMFQSCTSLTSLYLSNFNTSNVIDMWGMFAGCSFLTSLDISNFNTSNVTNMSYMFSSCSSLTNLDLSNFNASKVTDMSRMFNECSSLTTTINIMNANVTNYSSMFYDAATASGSKITVNYIADASALVDNMIATKSSNSNVVKGIQI